MASDEDPVETWHKERAEASAAAFGAQVDRQRKAVNDAAASEDAYVAALPPFTKEAKCSKCGSQPKSVSFEVPEQLGTWWYATAMPTHSGYMSYECGYCCYVWGTRTLDSEE